MNLIDYIHERYVYNRRINTLTDIFSVILPKNAKVLDIGCGDGHIGMQIKEQRPDISIQGVDVLIRPKTFLTVKKFDGKHLPYDDNSFDAAMFVDVLHHTNDPKELLTEAKRITRSLIVIKDHTLNGFFADLSLRFMDRVGNTRHGVSIPANFWSEEMWRENFAKMDLSINFWTKDIPLYPWWASWIFGRSLHFVAALSKE